MANESVGKELTESELDASANFDAALSDAEVQEMERHAQSVGLSRRMTLLAMSRDADTLSRLSIESPDVYGEMLEAVEGFKTHAEALLQASEAAVMRLKVADCRNAVSA